MITLFRLFRSSTTPLDAKNQNRLIQTLRSDPILRSRYDVEMILTHPDEDQYSASTSMGKMKESGGYSIRRSKIDVSSIKADESYWAERTLYVECLPYSVKTLPQVSSFVNQLVQLADPSPQQPSPLIQSVSFVPPPPVRNGNENSAGQSATKSQGFAFITMRDLAQHSAFLHDWPWDRNNSTVGTTSSLTIDARRLGFRSTSIPEWVRRRDEYLSYQAQLSGAASRSQLPAPRPPQPDAFPRPSTVNRDSLPPARSQDLHITEEASRDPPAYPLGRLIFVKNVHPETSKTTLKQFLGKALVGFEGAPGVVKGKEIDYVDYQKNMDSCHIRLTDPGISQRVGEYFSTQALYQLNGLADTPSLDGDKSSKPVHVEVVTGLKEELYWMKLPEKVRLEALREGGGSTSDSGPSHQGAGNRKRQRKR
ncbi:hypothetical protein DL93DRAFT_429236 [Clavulina sp. PMI_390]|nr:hypothetical protein DL93DRAFT_429236 [Clavulina sp. PMI_390]